MNLNYNAYNEFINEVVERLYYWCNYYNELKNTLMEKEKYGIYAEFRTNYNYCSNTGIYGISCTKEEIENRGNECMFFEGFNWTKEKLRIELDKVILKIWKEKETNYKLKMIEKDFK